MVELLRRSGVPSDLFHGAALLSIGASIYAWRSAKENSDQASAERLGIFIGLWAPTFWLIGNALELKEQT